MLRKGKVVSDSLYQLLAPSYLKVAKIGLAMFDRSFHRVYKLENSTQILLQFMFYSATKIC